MDDGDGGVGESGHVSQASMFEEGHQEQQKKKGMLATILCKAPFMERRMQHIMTGFKHVIQVRGRPRAGVTCLSTHARDENSRKHTR